VPNPTSSADAAWIHNSDAMFLRGTPTNIQEVLRIYRDGTTISLGQMAFSGNDFTDAIPTDGDVIILIGGVSYELHPITWVTNRQKIFTSSISTPQDGVYLRNRAGVMKFYQASGRNYQRFNITTDTLEDTVEVFPSGANITQPVRWVRDQVLAFFRADGSLRLFDVDIDKVILDSFIEVSEIITVDTRYQNIVSIRGSDFVVQTYDLAIQPTKLVNFTATPGNYDRYHTEALAITVQGFNSEPVEGIQVEWRVEILGAESGAANTEELGELFLGEGASVSTAKGKITPNVSLTDASGIARATYCPPGLDWVSGDKETITTTVKT